MFWALAVLVSWGAGTIVAVSTQRSFVNGVKVHSGALPLPVWLALVLLLISGSGPAIAAIIVSATEAGPGGVRALLSQVLRWRAGLHRYAVALSLPTLLTLLATAVWAVATGVRPDRWLPFANTFQLLGLPILLGGEELGWRVLTPAANGLDLAGLGVILVYIVGDAVLIGWAYNGGGRRLPLGVGRPHRAQCGGADLSAVRPGGGHVRRRSSRGRPARQPAPGTLAGTITACLPIIEIGLSFFVSALRQHTFRGEGDVRRTIGSRGAAGNPAERFAAQVVQIRGAAEHRTERI